MSINRIALKNFKCFRELDLTLPKITLLTGANSSGKSSVLYGLLAPFQSREFPLYLSPNGKYVNMGDFIEISFGNAESNEIRIDFSAQDAEGDKYEFKTGWIINPSNNLPKLNFLQVTSTLFEVKAIFNALNGKYSVHLQIYFNNDSNARNYFNVSKILVPLTRSGHISENNFSDFLTKRKRLEIKSIELQIETVDELLDDSEGTKNAVVGNIIRMVLNFIQEVDNDINFISSFRHQPERTYYQKAKSDNKVGRFGEGYIDQILEWQDRKSPKFAELGSIMTELTLLEAISAQKLTGGRFEIRVQAQKDGPWCSLADVGFGISQLLPIIVADLQLSSNSTLLVAQPEIHLHPSVQATLGDYLVRRANETNKRYILETHSEYLLNRLRLAIVKGEIEPSDIAVYYFSNLGSGSTTYPVEFTQDGQILGAPREFFDTYMMDVMEIALQA